MYKVGQAQLLAWLEKSLVSIGIMSAIILIYVYAKFENITCQWITIYVCKYGVVKLDLEPGSYLSRDCLMVCVSFNIEH